ncbi:MAG: redox-sensing transcriptional repressor Rex [Spirochaetales bacterium]|nr:redox-sensing transcriptional repressor Rex [Spirochaetales bacterium]
MQNIPLPAKRRLVLLERLLSAYKEKTITSQKIQELTGWTSAVVRRDISWIDVKCGATNGYKVAELKAALIKSFNLDKTEQRCCIVGLGRMGQALLDTSELFESSFKIVAGFDSSVNKTEVLSSAFPLHPTTLMKKIIKEEAISFAILTVDPEEAQPMTELLLECGIKGIVNYTPCVLTVPKGVSVENVSLLTALSTLAIQ